MPSVRTWSLLLATLFLLVSCGGSSGPDEGSPSPSAGTGVAGSATATSEPPSPSATPTVLVAEIPRLTAEPVEHDFGTICVVDCAAALTVDLSNPGREPIEVLDDGSEVAGASEAFSLESSCGGATLGPGTACQLTVRFIAPAVGLHELTLPIAYGGGEGERLVLSFSGTGIEPILGANVTAHQFDTCVWDCRDSLTIEFRADNAAEVVIDPGIARPFLDSPAFGVTGDCSNVRLAGTTDVCRMTLDFAPDTPGDYSVQWVVGYRNARAPLVIPIGARGVCTEPIPAESLNILGRRIGYGGNATGGAGGCLYRVTTDAERGPGSLRAGAERGNAWIVFDDDYQIWVRSGLSIAPNTTIDGRGRNISIAGGSGSLAIHERNVIVTGITLSSPNAGALTDGLEINGPRATDIWIDHVSFFMAPDELLPIWVDAATGPPGDITVTWSRFGEGGLASTSEQSNTHGILIGAQAADGAAASRTRITLAYNVFRTNTRSPLVGDGARAHIFNNYYPSWGAYAIMVRRNGQIRSENNVFAGGGADSNAFVLDESRSFGAEVLFDQGSYFPDGASGTMVRPEAVFTPDYGYQLLPADDSLAALIDGSAGP